MDTAIIIPSRYTSSRLPGKALADIHGKPLIQWVYEACKKVGNANEVVVATDHTDIAEVILDLNGDVRMTSQDHQSGTDRCAEVAHELQVEYIINVQGDEPFINPQILERMITHLKNHRNIDILTLFHSITDAEEIADPSKVKLTKTVSDRVLYFSRSPIPYDRSGEKGGYFKHVGIYAFKRSTLLEITKLPVSELEKTEGLEQLRWLENGYAIHGIEIQETTIGVDTPEDLEKARSYASSHH